MTDGSSEDLLDEAAIMLGMAFRRMRMEGKTSQEIELVAYGVSRAILRFVDEVVNVDHT